ncbi:uroporphyrinogen-III C-methyltransferase [Archaeoglobus sp.]
MTVGKVYIVGAGPGDPDLLTVKALKVLREADVILHDELIGDGIKELLRSTKAKLVDVGKRAGKHKMRQDEINELMVKLAREGKVVVRLKGGDPFVFGRGGEEAEYLAKHGIPFEVVPGITSAIAVPAYAGIPITHREFDPAVVFITGREWKERLNWKALAELNATIVILMGVSNLENIVKRLLKNGKNPKTPTAIIEKGCTPQQRVVISDLENVVDVAKKDCVKAPAVIVIGDVVRIRKKLAKFLRNLGSFEHA